ncbi:hypothetical protein M6B38_378810 [Iris pallida]|uniref:Uncharacterized protein n=1 Tax=Iris pallida TaxID=29817 RepID=A0AAX6G9L1_IRIPA|nr:hypothetical protein M6B38_378810 [Iris pallida]
MAVNSSEGVARSSKGRCCSRRGSTILKVNATLEALPRRSMLALQSRRLSVDDEQVAHEEI